MDFSAACEKADTESSPLFHWIQRPMGIAPRSLRIHTTRLTPNAAINSMFRYSQRPCPC